MNSNSPRVREAYNLAIQMYEDPDSDLYMNGSPRRGTANRNAFWDGFSKSTDKPRLINNTTAWAYFMAGRDCRDYEGEE